MMAVKKLTDAELCKLVEEFSSDDDNMDFSPSESSYNPSSDDSNNDTDDEKGDDEDLSSNNETDDEKGDDEDLSFECNDKEPQQCEIENSNFSPRPAIVEWTIIKEHQSFRPKFSFPDETESKVLLHLRHGASELEVFSKLFPRSLLLHIAECTNKRLKKWNKDKGVKRSLTDEHEISLILGICLVMHYNHLPSMADYWSKHPSMGNEMIKKSISRDRFTLIHSKLYFADCTKPPNAPKDYYISDVISCFKKTFMAARSESTFQSIDESMTKFKGRSSLKQYLPMKPIKRGIKIWMRCDAKTGYTYDFNLYTGRDTNFSSENSTLGERVVTNLVKSIRESNVVIAFDRFFTSVQLLKTITFAAVGTYNRTRKNMPVFQRKLQRGEGEFQVSYTGITASRWMDSKEVLVLSNCHYPIMTEVQRKLKDGTKKTLPCPHAIVDYNKIMGGVDLADQKAALYDINRKSQKWWKKVFFKLFMVAVVNAWIVHQQNHRKKTSLLQFIIPLAESIIDKGLKHKKLKTRQTGGRPSKSRMDVLNIGEHLPIENSSRKRCVRCSSLKKEKRTKFVCSGCNNALCYACFTPFHK